MGQFEVDQRVKALYFTQSHEWIAVEGECATVGVTDYAQRELGEIVYVELPIVGHVVRAGDEITVLESTKAAIDLYTPLSGEIVAVNTALQESPEKVNLEPETDGWLFKLKITDPKELTHLLDLPTYRKYIPKEQ